MSDKLKKTGKTDIGSLPFIDVEEFLKVINTRRAVRVFDGSAIPEEIVLKCMDNAFLAPNSSNLQPWEFYWVKNDNKREQLVKACFSQSPAKTASELFVITARTSRCLKQSKELAEIYITEGSELSRKNAAYYQKLVPLIYGQGLFGIFGLYKRIYSLIVGAIKPVMREPFSPGEMKLWAVKSTALAAENFLLSFRAFGFDSCPLEGYDSKRIKRLLNLPGDGVVVMVVCAGKRAQNGLNGERIRLDSSRFIKKI